FRFVQSPARRWTLEFEAALAGRLRQRSDASVIPITAAVEDHIPDALAERPLGDQLADRRGGADIGAGLEASAHVLLDRRGGRERLAFFIVDDLGIDVLGGAEYRKPRAAAGS